MSLRLFEALLLSIFIVFALYAEPAVPQNPCQDSTYQALMAKDYSSLTRKEQRLFDKMKNDCAKRYDLAHPDDQVTDEILKINSKTARYSAHKGTIAITTRAAMGLCSPGEDIIKAEESVLKVLDVGQLRVFQNQTTGEVVYDLDRAEEYTYSSGLFGVQVSYYLSGRIAVGLEYYYNEMDQNLSLSHYMGTHDPDGNSNDKSWSASFMTSNEIGPILSIRMIQRKRFVLFGSVGISCLLGSILRNSGILAFYDENRNDLDTVSTVVANIGDIQRANKKVGFKGVGGNIGLSAAFFLAPFINIQCGPQLDVAKIYFDDNFLTSYPKKTTTVNFSINVAVGLQFGNVRNQKTKAPSSSGN